MAVALLVSPDARTTRRGTAGIAGTALKRQLGLLPLVMVFFFTVCGGAHGLEPVVKLSGPGMALALILVTPFIWSIPAALMVAELSAAIPVEGGYYAWVKKALGPFWGFQEGWWSWLSSFVDMAIYPVLFAKYLASFLSEALGVTWLTDNPVALWIAGLPVIWLFAYLNIRGVRLVGNSLILFGVIVLSPFVVLSVVGFARLFQDPSTLPMVWQPVVPPDQTLLGAFGAGLFVVMWNYQGWDSVSTVNGEVQRPRRNGPLAIWVALPLVVASYLLPTIAGLASGFDWTKWEDGSFPQIATALGGPLLGSALAVGGMMSAAALFNANLLTVSRLPFVLAEDGYLPGILKRLHPRYATPWVSVVVCAVVYSIFTWQSFATLVVIDVITYAATLLLEFGALIVFRLRYPAMERPYRVPGGWTGVLLVTILPTLIMVGAIVSQVMDPEEGGLQALALSAGALATGVVLYPILRLLFKRGQPDVPVPLGEAAAGEAPLPRASAWSGGAVASLVPANRPAWTP